MRFQDPRQYVQDDPKNKVFKIHRDVFRDPELFELEMKYIFEGNWIFLGLESQVERPHDFYCTRIGRQPVIISRDEQGKLHCLLNTCRHRGATVCHTEAGNRKYHVCNYHGWAYDSSGACIAVKDQESGAYPPDFAKEDHGLVPVARFGTYGGLMFGSLNPDVLPLEEHLGELRLFIDLAMQQGANGMELVPGRSRYTYGGNWKMQVDNGSDGYHLTSTHVSFMRIVHRRAAGESGTKTRMPDFKKRMQLDAGCYTFENGHSVIWNETPDIEAQPLYQHIDEIRSRVGDLKAQWMMNSRNITIYPNVQIADTTSLVLRTITPIAVDKTEMNLWCLAIKGEDPEVRRTRIRQHEDFFNVSGMATPDDTICYEDCQDGSKAWATEWLQAAERGIDDMHPGGNEHSEKLGFKPAWSVRGAYRMQNEVVFHAAYRQWSKLMEAGMRREHNARLAAE